VLTVGVLSTTLGILLGQLDGKCCSEFQIQHRLLVSNTFTVANVVVVAISLIFRMLAMLGCGGPVVLNCGVPAV